MSGLSALASYDISDDEETSRIVDSEEESEENKEVDAKEEEEDGNDDVEVGDARKDEESEKEDLIKDEDDHYDDDHIKDVEDLSVIQHDDEMDAGESSGEDVEGEEHDDVMNLGSTLKIQAKKRAKRKSSENATELAKKLRSASVDEVQIPPEPEGRCSASLQEKISRFLEKKVKQGEDLNRAIQARKDFRNPSIYEKLILYLGIEELGTNFPKEDYNPKMWRKAPAYDDLARAQREDMSKREKERKTKVEFVTGTVKKPTPASSQGGGSGDAGKRTKWDQQVNVSRVSSDKSSGSSSKPTVISAIGSIKKPKV